MSRARTSRRRVVYLLEAPLRRRRLLIAPTLLLSAAAATLVFLLPARYRAAALVGVEWAAFDPAAPRPERLDRAELRSQAVRQRVTERALLERTLEEAAPYATGGTPAVTDAEVERLRSDLRVRPMATSTFVIEFEHSDPAKAALVPNVLVRRLVEARDAGHGPVTRFELLTLARLPAKPESSSPAVFGLVGALVGLLLGLGGAMVAEARDRSVKGPEDLEDVLPVPLLATLPEVRVPEERR